MTGDVLQNEVEAAEAANDPGTLDRLKAFGQSLVHHAAPLVAGGAAAGAKAGSLSFTPVGVAAGAGIGAGVGAIAGVGATIHDFFKEGGVNDQVTSGEWETDKGIIYNGAKGATRVVGGAVSDAVEGTVNGTGEQAGGFIDDAKNYIDEKLDSMGLSNVGKYMPLILGGGLLLGVGSMMTGHNGLAGGLGGTLGLGLLCVVASKSGLLDKLGFGSEQSKDNQSSVDVETAMKSGMDESKREQEAVASDVSEKRVAQEQQREAVGMDMGADMA